MDDTSTTAVDSSCEEFEEVLVYVEFPDFDECSFLNETSQIELIGMLDPEPTCKINNLVFKGHYEINLGTQLFFEESSDQNNVEYAGQAVNIVKFKLSSIENAP